MKVRYNNEMTCGVFQHNRDISAHQGQWIDLKQFPDRACEMPEAKAWPGLGKFVADINRDTPFRTTGCTAHGKTPGGHDAPSVDIAFDDQRLRGSENAHHQLQEDIRWLDGSGMAKQLTVEMCDCNALMPEGAELFTTRLWFLGSRPQAEEAFPAIVSLLSKLEPEKYVPLTEGETVYRRADCGTDSHSGPNFLRSIWRAITGR